MIAVCAAALMTVEPRAIAAIKKKKKNGIPLLSLPDSDVAGPDHLALAIRWLDVSKTMRVDVMTIQIFGSPKCKRTRAAERFFKERKIRVQMIDLAEQNLSPGEFDAVKNHVGLEAMIDASSKEYKRLGLQHLSFDLEQKLREHPLLLMTPVVRHGSEVTVGAKPDVWKTWI